MDTQAILAANAACREADAAAPDPGPVRILHCCCCGAATRGRQWYNRDTGYGLCRGCVDRCSRNETPEEVKSLYGVRGVHYDLPENSEK